MEKENIPQHIFLWGSSGTGKTLLLVEILQMYFAFFKLKKMKTKALVIAYHNLMSNNAKLIADLNTKYFANVPADVDIQVMTLRQACEGMYFLGYCS